MKKHVSTFRRTTYEINGVRYERLEDVPEEFRHLFVDADGNGVPDFVESSDEAVRTSTTSVSRWSGRPEEMPPEVRRLIKDLPPQGASADGAQLDSVRCAACGYDLAGSAIENRCPECGHPVMSSIRSLVQRRRALPLPVLAVILIVILVACWLLFGCATARPAPSDRVTTVETLRAAQHRNDFDAARDLLADDPRVWYGDRSGEGQPWRIEGGTWKAWDTHFRGRTERISPWTVARDAVWADMHEVNDYYRLTESPGGRWRATYFFDDNGRVGGFMVSGIPGETGDRGRRDEFQAWAREHHPQELEHLMPGGSIDPTRDRPARMRALLQAWRAAVALPPLR